MLTCSQAVVAFDMTCLRLALQINSWGEYCAEAQYPDNQFTSRYFAKFIAQILIQTSKHKNHCARRQRRDLCGRLIVKTGICGGSPKPVQLPDDTAICPPGTFGLLQLNDNIVGS